jgi:hypothetical protein
MNHAEIQYMQEESRENRRYSFEERFPYLYIHNVISPSVMDSKEDIKRIDFIIRIVERWRMIYKKEPSNSLIGYMLAKQDHGSKSSFRYLLSKTDFFKDEWWYTE